LNSTALLGHCTGWSRNRFERDFTIKLEITEGLIEDRKKTKTNFV